MKEHNTQQNISHTNTTVTIGNYHFKYDSVEVVKKQNDLFLECFINGELEDRFWVEITPVKLSGAVAFCIDDRFKD